MSFEHLNIKYAKFAFNLPEEVKHVFYMNILAVICATTLGLYIPIYVMKYYGVVFPWLSELKIAALFVFFAYGPVYAILMTISKRILERFGAEICYSLNIIVSILCSLSVTYLPPTLAVFFLIVALYAFARTCFWMAQHEIFGTKGKREELGKELSLLRAVNTFFSITMPLASALIIASLGFKVQFTLFSLIVLCGIVYVLKHVKMTKIKVEKKKEMTKKLKALYLLTGPRHLSELMLGLLVYFVAKTVLIYGGIISLVSLLSVIVAFVIAKFVDKKHDFALGTMGLLLEISAFVMLVVLPVPVNVYLSKIFIGILYPMLAIPWESFAYNLNRKYGTYFVYVREIYYAISRAIFGIVLLVLPVILAIKIFLLIMIVCSFIYYNVTIEEEMVLYRKEYS